MNTQQRWNYIKNNREIIEQYMAQHKEEARTRQLVKFLKEGTDKIDFDIKCPVIQLHNIAREVEQQIGVGELSQDIRECADRLNELIKAQS
jgi:replicative DNA helicase